MSEPTPATEGEFRSGFACFVGRPNAGKSTLTNALVGQKVAITSGRPQTTRHTIRGIVHRDDAQLVLVDTPGLHRPRTLLGERLNDMVKGTLTEVDVVGFCLPADQKVGPGDRFIADQLADLTRGRRGTPVVAVVTKADLVSRQRLAEQLLAVQALGDWADIVPVSAVRRLPGPDGWPTCSSRTCLSGAPCTSRVSSPTSPRRSWSPSSSARPRWRACATSCRTRWRSSSRRSSRVSSLRATARPCWTCA